jgi:hypothetical protein
MNVDMSLINLSENLLFTIFNLSVPKAVYI